MGYPLVVVAAQSGEKVGEGYVFKDGVIVMDFSADVAPDRCEDGFWHYSSIDELRTELVKGYVVLNPRGGDLNRYIKAVIDAAQTNDRLDVEAIFKEDIHLVRNVTAGIIALEKLLLKD
jgi:hypothetical protein